MGCFLSAMTNLSLEIDSLCGNSVPSVFLTQYMLFQRVTSNCPGALIYKYSFNKGITKNTTSTTDDFNIDGDETYNFTVQAINTAGLLSDIVSINGRTEEISKFLTFIQQRCILMSLKIVQT